MTRAKRDSILYLTMLLTAAVFVIFKMIRGFTVTDEEGGVWNIIQLFYIGTGCLFLMSRNREHNSFRCIRLCIFFFLYIWFLSLFPFLFSNKSISQIFGFLTVPYGLMVLITFFSVGKRVPINKHSEVLSISFFLISAILFVAMRSFRMQVGEQGALADIYYIVALLPLILVYFPKKFSIIPYIVALVCVAMTGKRGAFVAMIAIFIIYYFFPYYNSKGKKTSVFFRVLILVFAFAVAYFVLMRFVGRYSLNIFDRIEQVETDGGSGRLIRWAKVLAIFQSDTNFFQLIFGHGCNFTMKELGGHAHNDFLEFLLDYGLLAVGLYILFFLSLFREGFRMYKARFRYSREFMCSLSVAFCMALFSFYAIDCTHITCSVICQGLILADWYNYKRNGYQDAN